MFSYHANRRSLGQASHYAHGWKPYESSVRSLSLSLYSVATSPIVFKNGHRREDNFLSADWVGLDFDEGPSLAEMENTFCDAIHVIGTTKSHQKPKGEQPACDRFRVFLRLEHTITSAEDYKATVRSLVKTYDADPACVGAAQMFWPCHAITSVSSEGFTTDVVVAEKRSYAQIRPEYNGRIPPWVRAWLNGEFDLTPDKKWVGRNFYVYKTAVWLAKNQWQEREIMDVVMGSKLPINSSPEVEREVGKAVRSGVRRAHQELDKRRGSLLGERPPCRV